MFSAILEPGIKFRVFIHKLHNSNHWSTVNDAYYPTNMQTHKKKIIPIEVRNFIQSYDTIVFF